MAIGFKSHTRFLLPKSFLITEDNCALLNIYSPFNSPRGCIACLRDWEPNAIIKQLVKSTCLCQCERCLNYADCNLYLSCEVLWTWIKLKGIPCSPNWLARRTKQIRVTSSTHADVYHATFTGSNVFRRMCLEDHWCWDWGGRET